MARIFLVIALVLGVSQFALGTCYEFKRGDVNNNGNVPKSSMEDLSALYTVLMGGGGPPNMDACDVNDDGTVDSSDYSYLYAYCFSSGSAPPAPFTTAGFDLTLDSINATCDIQSGDVDMADLDNIQSGKIDFMAVYPKWRWEHNNGGEKIKSLTLTAECYQDGTLVNNVADKVQLIWNLGGDDSIAPTMTYDLLTEAATYHASHHLFCFGYDDSIEWTKLNNVVNPAYPPSEESICIINSGKIAVVWIMHVDEPTKCWGIAKYFSNLENHAFGSWSHANDDGCSSTEHKHGSSCVTACDHKDEGYGDCYECLTSFQFKSAYDATDAPKSGTFYVVGYGLSGIVPSYAYSTYPLCDLAWAQVSYTVQYATFDDPHD